MEQLQGYVRDLFSEKTGNKISNNMDNDNNVNKLRAIRYQQLSTSDSNPN